MNGVWIPDFGNNKHDSLQKWGVIQRMMKPNSDCDVSPMLINLKEDIKLIDVRIQKVLENFDDENHCLLG